MLANTCPSWVACQIVCESLASLHAMLLFVHALLWCWSMYHGHTRWLLAWVSCSDFQPADSNHTSQIHTGSQVTSFCILDAHSWSTLMPGTGRVDWNMIASPSVLWHIQRHLGLHLTTLPDVWYSCPADLLAAVSHSSQRSSTSSRSEGLLNLQLAVCVCEALVCLVTWTCTWAAAFVFPWFWLYLMTPFFHHFMSL